MSDCSSLTSRTLTTLYLQIRNVNICEKLKDAEKILLFELNEQKEVHFRDLRFSWEDRAYDDVIEYDALLQINSTLNKVV